MTPARSAFLAGLIDYAGLFPPATLALEPALGLYGRYRAGADAWMLGRFLIPAARLAEADALIGTVTGDAPVRLSVLGAAAPGAVGPDAPGLPPDVDVSAAWLAMAETAMSAARVFASQHPGRVLCDAFELRTAPALARDADALAGALAAFAPRLGAAGCAAIEIPYLDAPDTPEPATAAIADANRKVGEAHGRLGRAAFAVKVRCGGEGIPSPEALAGALTAARRAGVAFKATAGLHHPLRHDTPDGPAHGFINVFGGAILAAVHGLGADDLAEILDSRDAAEWDLGETLRWRRLEARPGQIAAARESVALAYGSCSFDEPRDDLRALGWLEDAGGV